jgi:hypothetical protein
LAESPSDDPKDQAIFVDDVVKESPIDLGIRIGEGMSMSGSVRRGSVTPTCIHCRGTMKKTTLSSGSCSGCVLGLIVLLAGLVVLNWGSSFEIVTSGYGGRVTLFGALLCLLGLCLGLARKRRKVWMCTQCGFIFDRA